MIYGSVCSGIEAATVAWHPLGWTPAWFAEIDAFPCAVLAHHYPDVLNYGDFARIPDSAAPIDVLVGGTPCQSFSIAGRKAGLDDPRGQLTLEFLRLAGRLKPRWIVWENVSNVLSIDGGDAFRTILDGFESLGYIIDVDILDAQFFGVPQRRRRIFICGQHRDDLLNQTTDSSALTIAQCLQEILHGILIGQQLASGNALQNSASLCLSKDGLMRKMKLFGLHGLPESLWPKLRDNLVAAYQRCLREQSISDAAPGASDSELTADGLSSGSQKERPSTNTAPLLAKALDEAYEVMKSCITSTATNKTTASEIYTCSIAALNIAKLIARLNHCSPCFWSAASSSLTALQDFIGYARSTTSDLFGDVERFSAWGDFLTEAERTNDALGCIRVGCFGEVFPLPEGLRRNPSPRQDAPQDLAPTLNGSTGGAGSGMQPVTIAPTLPARRNSGGGFGTDFECDGGLITHTLRAEGHDASEDGTGRGVPLVASTLKSHHGGIDPSRTFIPVAFAENSRGELRLESGDGQRTGSLSSGGGKPGQGCPVCFDLRGRDGGAQLEGPHNTANIRAVSGDVTHEIAPCLQERECNGQDSDATRAMVISQGVRRLTPRECERLQGFSDDYTLVPYRGKLAADSPRYRAIGNSMAVPVMRWIGEGIQMVEDSL